MTWRKGIKVESIQANKSKNLWLSVTSCLPYVQTKGIWDEKQDKCSWLKNFCSEGVTTWPPACLHFVSSGSHICCPFPLLFIYEPLCVSIFRKTKKKWYVFFLCLCLNRAGNLLSVQLIGLPPDCSTTWVKTENRSAERREPLKRLYYRVGESAIVYMCVFVWV